MKITYAGLTHVGRVRKQNQDAIALPGGGEPWLFVLSDGMGGAQGGEVASGLVAPTSGRAFAQARASGAGLAQALASAVEEANREIFRRAEAESRLWGMGATVAAAAQGGAPAQAANVGDSRCYLFRAGRLRQVTRDNSLVEEELARGVITPAEARDHQMKNVLTRAVGSRPQVEVDLYTLDLRDGDVILICSDGLHGPLDEAALARELSRAGGDVERAAQAMVDAANREGGPDNIAVIVIRVDDAGRRRAEADEEMQPTSADPLSEAAGTERGKAVIGGRRLGWLAPLVLAILAAALWLAGAYPGGSPPR